MSLDRCGWKFRGGCEERRPCEQFGRTPENRSPGPSEEPKFIVGAGEIESGARSSQPDKQL